MSQNGGTILTLKSVVALEKLATDLRNQEPALAALRGIKFIMPDRAGQGMTVEQYRQGQEQATDYMIEILSFCADNIRLNEFVWLCPWTSGEDIIIRRQDFWIALGRNVNWLRRLALKFSDHEGRKVRIAPF